MDNNLWDLRIRQRTDEGYFTLADEFAGKIMDGEFSATMREQFVRIINYYGQDPYIIRSSSILEDGFGNAFAGKYESVFCVNRGTPEERLQEFEKAIKTVYASSMSLSALDYRKRRGLDKRDEQMALLIQRVSGYADSKVKNDLEKKIEEIKAKKKTAVDAQDFEAAQTLKEEEEKLTEKLSLLQDKVKPDENGFTGTLTVDDVAVVLAF